MKKCNEFPIWYPSPGLWLINFIQNQYMAKPPVTNQNPAVLDTRLHIPLICHSPLHPPCLNTAVADQHKLRELCGNLPGFINLAGKINTQLTQLNQCLLN